jgi:hypothetical protein
LLLVHATPGDAMTGWHVVPMYSRNDDENVSFVVTHAKPECRERSTGRAGLDGHGTAGGGPPVRDAVSSPNRVTGLTRERFGVCPLREHRS